MKRKIPLIFLSLVGIVVCAVLLETRHRHRDGPTPSSPLSHEVYIWQRAWTADVRDAIAAAKNDFSNLVVLGAEVSFSSGRWRTARVEPDWSQLRQAGGSVGIALRIGPYRGPFTADDDTTRRLSDLAAALVANAKSASVAPAELQIDFDCAESKLDGYRVWLEAIRSRIKPTPLTFTALPSWLNHSNFAPLARASDGYVLQVHSLDRPKSIDQPMSLCDPTAALSAVETAGRIAVPFRVALPTYGYLVAFNENGTFVGLSAEGPNRDWPATSRVRTLCADPDSLAALVSLWSSRRPLCMTGVIWYRLPVAGDSLNWRMPTLRAVMVGRAPAPIVRADIHRTDPGLFEVALHNEGDGDAPLNSAVRLRWSGAALVAADGLGGFEQSASGRGLLFRKSRDVPIERLAPGDHRAIGWVRLSDDKEIHADVSTDHP